MAIKQQSEPPKERAKQETEQKNALIGKNVLQILGQPTNLYRLQVQQLWESRYRVNVLLGVDAATVKVAHSYFLVADGDGNILASTPQITRHY